MEIVASGINLWMPAAAAQAIKGNVSGLNDNFCSI